jgi:hypothetical protein
MSLHIENESELQEAHDAFLDDDVGGGAWLVLNYVGPSIVSSKTSGSGSVEELRNHFEDDQIQYALVRLAVPGQTGRFSTRDVFVQWTGPAVDLAEKGKKFLHVDVVHQRLQPFNAYVRVTHRQRFDTERWVICTPRLICCS